MNALSAIANYSDDDDDELQEEEGVICKETQQTRTVHDTEVKQTANVKPGIKRQQQQKTLNPSPIQSTLTPPPPSLSPRSPSKATDGLQETTVVPEAVRRHLGSIDKVRQRRSLLTSKPVEGVENWGIPPEPTTECDRERRESIQHFISLRRSGHRLNDHLERNKAFRNPRIYAKLVEFIELDEIGSNFDKSEFDPHGFPPDATIDGILESQRRFAEEKAAQQQNRSSIAFVNSSNPPTVSAPTAAATAAASVPHNAEQILAAAMANAAKVASRITQEQVAKRKDAHETRDEHHSSKRQR